MYCGVCTFYYYCEYGIFKLCFLLLIFDGCLFFSEYQNFDRRMHPHMHMHAYAHPYIALHIHVPIPITHTLGSCCHIHIIYIILVHPLTLLVPPTMKIAICTHFVILFLFCELNKHKNRKIDHISHLHLHVQRLISPTNLKPQASRSLASCSESFATSCKLQAVLETVECSKITLGYINI